MPYPLAGPPCAVAGNGTDYPPKLSLQRGARLDDLPALDQVPGTTCPRGQVVRTPVRTPYSCDGGMGKANIPDKASVAAFGGFHSARAQLKFVAAMPIEPV